MIENNYSDAYVEVLETLYNLKEDDYNKIPKEYIAVLKQKSNKEYTFKYDSAKSFQEQNLSQNAKLILFFFFEKFGANQNQKRKIREFKLRIIAKKEIEKANKYKSKNLFKKAENREINNSAFSSEKAMVKYETNFFTKIKNYIVTYFLNNLKFVWKNKN